MFKTKRKSRVNQTPAPAVSAGYKAPVKTLALTPEVQAIVNRRHEAHRRGQYQVIGSISFLETAHGAMRFPVRENIPSGPTLAYALEDKGGRLEVNEQELILLTEWKGLPDLREKLPGTQCNACLRTCDVCSGGGRKVCEGVGCGGRGWRPGPLVDCKEPGCLEETGHFNPACQACKGNGQLPEPVKCEMCDGTGEISCSRCRGTGKYSTGIVNAGTNFMDGRCKTCHGEQCQVKVTPQRVEHFVNAFLPDPVRGPFVAIGPIFAIAIDLTMEKAIEYNTPVRVFDVEPDALGDYLFLLMSSETRPIWPYMIGGFLRERNDAGAVMVMRGSRQQE